MIQLPSRLRAWEPELALLAQHARASLGPWLPILEQGIGPPARDRSDPRGEIDGFSGLSRRGPYERLLISEWSFAEAAPEEFLRRATNGEHMFYQLAHRHPAPSRRMVVLFDGGPQQIGTPRLAHLALLLLASARAREANTELRWSILQSYWEAKTNIEAEDLKIFSRPGSDHPPTDDEILFALAEHDVIEGEAELWFVGSQELEPHAQAWNGRLLEVTPPLILGEQALLRVQQIYPRSHQTVTELELPPSWKALSILRNPTEDRSPITPRFTFSKFRRASLALAGRHVFYFDPLGVSMSRAIASERRLSRTRRLTFEGDLLAIGGSMGMTSFVLSSVGKNEIQLRFFSKKGKTSSVKHINGTEGFVLPETGQPPAQLVESTQKLPRCYHFVDTTQQFWLVKIDQQASTLRPLAQNIILFGRDGKKGVWAVQHCSSNTFKVLEWDLRGDLEAHCTINAITEAGALPCTNPPHSKGPSFLYLDEDRHWVHYQASTKNRTCWAHQPGAETIGGLLKWPTASSASIYLVRISDNRHTIWLEEPSGQISHSQKTHQPIRNVEISTEGVASLLVELENGEVEVYQAPDFARYGGPP